MSKMRRAVSKTLSVVVIVIVIVAVLGGAYYFTSLPSTTTTSMSSMSSVSSASSVAQGPVNIGIILPLTGGDAYSGQLMLQGALMGEKYVNDHGGILGRPVKILVEDDKSDLPTATQAATKLVTEDNVIALGDFYKSFITRGVYSSVSAKYNILTFTAGWVDTLTGVDSNGNPNFPLMFRAGPHEGAQVTQWVAFIEMISAQTGRNKIALYSEDDDYGHGFQDPLAAALKADGKVQVVYNNYHDYSATDFTADLANVKASGANLFWTSTVSANVMTMIKQASLGGVSAQAIMMTVADGFYYTDEYAKTVGTAGDHVIITTFHKPGVVYTNMTPVMDQLYFQMGYGPRVSYYITMQVFEDVLIMAQAANIAGSTATSAMIKALETNTFVGPWGSITFPSSGPNYHQWTPSMLFEQYQNLTLKVIYPTAEAEASIILPS